MKSDVYFASASDFHLGHPNTTTVEILDNIRRAFPDNEETGRLDVIFFGGDLFDGLMSLDDPNVDEIMAWMYEFLAMCKRRDIIFRVLEGTPSHDWRQPRLFELINTQQRLDTDFKYVSTLSIEYIERLGIHVLYVPDEWRPDTEDTWKEVLELLREHSLETVDFAVMHGNFSYQLPEVAKAPKHIPERYLDIVTHYILVGHVHFPSRYERILANGSFDRISQGEEHAKGHWRVRVRLNGDDEVVFKENKYAKVYMTIDCRGLTVDEMLKKLEMVRELPNGSFLRVACERSNPILTSLDLIRRYYPLVRWSTPKVIEDGPSPVANMLVDMRSSFQQLNITRDNIEELLMSRIQTQTQDPVVLKRCEAKLREMV